MPSYGSLGLLAPILVLAARLLQGFSVGGEFASATAFLVEHRPDRAGFFASWQWSSQGLAALIATSFGVLLTTTMSAANLQAWGWRIPFAFGLLIGPVGYYIRSHMEETPEFLDTAPLHAPSSPSVRSPPRPARNISSSTSRHTPSTSWGCRSSSASPRLSLRPRCRWSWCRLSACGSTR